MKQHLRRLPVVPLSKRALQRELRFFADWYNEQRPHTWLGGKTPEEVYHGRRPACRGPRFEPRPLWPRPSPCAAPQALVKGVPGVRLDLHVTYHAARKHLPVVTLHRAA